MSAVYGTQDAREPILSHELLFYRVWVSGVTGNVMISFARQTRLEVTACIAELVVD